MHRLEGKIAIVTGAGTGIGQAIAARLGAEGAKVIVDYVGKSDGAEETLRLIERCGADGEIVMADITRMDDVRRLIDAAWNRFGSADILVNNAGMEIKSDFWDTTEEDYDRVMQVNLRGAFFLSQAFVRRLRDAKKPGRIVNISSVHEDMTFPGFATYCSSKGGLRMLMRNLAVELGPLGITVNNVAPGAIQTPINKALLEDKPKLNALLAKIPLGRLGTPEDVAGLVAFLATDDAAYVTGATFVIDGGLMRDYHEQ
jgi:glucose 1-dehydrogenase